MRLLERLRAESRRRNGYDLSGLADDLRDLADTAMRGCKGKQPWESLAGDIRVEARLHDGRVAITATFRAVRFDPANDGSSVCLDINLDPGEELRECARSVERLFQDAAWRTVTRSCISGRDASRWCGRICRGSIPRPGDGFLAVLAFAPTSAWWAITIAALSAAVWALITHPIGRTAYGSWLVAGWLAATLIA